MKPGSAGSGSAVTLGCVFQRADILDELQKSQKVFAEKLNHLSRRLAWINATIYSKVTCLVRTSRFWSVCGS